MPLFTLRATATSALAVILLSLPAGAEMVQFSNSIFAVPPGWETRQRNADFQSLSTKDGQPCEGCYFYVGRSQAASGSLMDFVERNQRMFLDEDDKTVEPLNQVEETDEAGYRIAMKAMKVDGDLMFLTGYRVDDRFQLLGFRGGMDTEKQLTETPTTFQSLLPAMLKTTRHVSSGAPPLMPRAVPGPLNGVWFGSATQSSLGMDGMMRMDQIPRLIVFWPSGYYHEGTPPTGLIPPDPANLREPTDTDYGTYTVDGDKVKLASANGDFSALTLKATMLSDWRTSLFPVTPLPDGSTIEGSISSFYYSGLGPGATSVGVQSSSFTAFRKDGTYGGETSGGAFGNFSEGMGGFAVNNADSNSGRYEIRNGVLTRYPADGSAPIVRMVFKSDDKTIIGSQVLMEN